MRYRLKLGMRRCNNETVLIRISKISDKLLRTSLWMIEVEGDLLNPQPVSLVEATGEEA